MIRLAAFVVLAALTHHHPALVALVVLAAAGAVAAVAVWSYRADPPLWEPPALWSGRFA
jgi:hypothetical protein